MKMLRPYLVGAVAGVSAALAQKPHGYWPLVFVSLVCFVSLLEAFRTTRINSYRWALCLGWIIYSAWMCSWISYFGTVALACFVFFEFLLAYGLASITARIFTRGPRCITYALIWVAFEWTQAHLPILSFSWLSLSTTMVDVAPIRTYARIGGGALISFFLVFVSSAIALNIKDRRTRTKRHIGIVRIFFVGLWMGAFIFVACASQITLSSQPTDVSVSVLQGNDKNRYLTQDEIDNEYLENSHLDLGRDITGKKDVIIFPESAFIDDPQTSQSLRRDLAPIARKARRLLILNTIGSESGDDVNRNYFYSPSMELLGTYDKRRLVPFGEYVPANSIIGSWNIFDDIGSGFVAGTHDTTIENITTLICFESTFTGDIDRALNKNSQLLVVTTNNRSYRRSGNSQQHLALTQLRAAEYGISIVQASVSGHSALIERDGSVIKQTKLFERKELSGNISFGHPDSIYSRTGDWLSLAALGVVGYLSLVRLRKFRWKNQTLTD